jgi:voltage-gated potassium channel
VIVAVSVPVAPSALQSLRAFRLVRLFRFVRLALLSTRAILIARRLFHPSGLRYVVVLVLLFVGVAGAAVAMVDSGNVESIWDGIWWAFVTVTTVGYGDVVPDSTAGRIIAIFVMVVGIGFYSILTATIAATFVHQDDKGGEERAEMRAEIREMRSQLDRIEQTLGERAP